MTRAYQLLLRLYPRGFADEYRHELCTVFAERTAHIRGPLRPLRVLAAALADVVPNALAAHGELLRRDLGYAARALRRTPGFAVTACLLVALGVGANTAAFSLAHHVLLRPLPYRDGDALVKVYQSTPEYGRTELSPGAWRDWREGARSFTAFGAYAMGAANLVGSAEPRRVEVASVSPEVLPLLGVPALAGRTLARADSADDAVVVLGYGLWQSQFGGADVVGKVVRLDGEPYTVVGVMPSTFRFPDRAVEAWRPLVFAEGDYADRGNTYLYGIARLRPGVDLAQAQRDLAAVARRVAERHPEAEAYGANVLRMRDEYSARARLLVLALCGAALCILLLACANLASLQLARAAGRGRELAVRAALGAGHDRLVRQLVTESLALTLLGALLGAAVAWAGVPLLGVLVPPTLPLADRPAVDVRVLAGALAAVGATVLAFGVLPAVRAGTRDPFGALRAGGRAGGGRTQRLRATLVMVEVAASVVLLVSSGLLIRAVLRIQATDPGFETERVLVARTALPWTRYAVTERRARFYDRVLGQLRGMPGVASAAYVTGLPMRMRGGIWPVDTVDGAALEGRTQRASLRFVTPGFFATLGIPLRRGRDVSERDARGQPMVAVVSESFARRYWPGQDPIGRRFTFALDERVVVGVAGDVRVRGLEPESEPQVYLAYRQARDSSLVYYPPRELVVRSTLPTATLLPAIRRAVREADPDQPVSDVAMLGEVVSEETAPRVTQVRLLGALSVVALLIAGLGIHGLLSYMVLRRTHELAVRRALGAPSRALVRLVLGEGLALAAAGVAVGAALSYPVARGMAALLAGVTPADPATLAGVALLCLAMAALGSLLPSLAASRVAPAAALRAD